MNQHTHNRWHDRMARGPVVGMLLFVGVLSLYVSTLAPGILGGDAGEMQLVPYILSLAHPSGYPLQTMFNRVWLWIFPWGSVAWRVNLLSAMIAAGGVALSYRLIRQLGDPATQSVAQAPALAAALLLAISPAYWSQAVTADKYALTALLTALLLLWSYQFYRRPQSSTLVLLALAAGLCLAHHRALAMFLPPLALMAMWRGRHVLVRPRNWLLAGAAFLAPLAMYGYVFWAAARSLPPWYPEGMRLAGFLDFLLVQGIVGQIRLVPQADGMAMYGQHLAAAFPPAIAVLGLAGLIVRARQRPADRCWLTTLMACTILSAYLAANYENYDLSRRYVYFLPSFVCAAVALGVGLLGLVEAVATWAGRSVRQAAPLPWLLAIGLLLPALLLLLAAWRENWQQQRTEQPLDIWRQALKSGGQADRLAAGLALVDGQAMIVGDWEQVTPLWYAQQVDGICPECQIRMDVKLLGEYVDQATAEGRPVYLTRTVFPVADWSFPTSAGPLVHLAAHPTEELPEQMMPLGISYDGRVELAGYTYPIRRCEPARGQVLPFSLIWRAQVDSPPAYAISLRLVGLEGELWRADNPAPVLSTHPFDHLKAGQVVADYHEVPLATDLPAGEYWIEAVLYQTMPDGTFETAPAYDAAGRDLERVGVIVRFYLGP